VVVGVTGGLSHAGDEFGALLLVDVPDDHVGAVRGPVLRTCGAEAGGAAGLEVRCVRSVSDNFGSGPTGE
jgi:hypothetical protein